MSRRVCPNHLCCVSLQNAEVTRQMTVARAVQDEVDAVRREMQGKLKAAQEFAETQVSVKATLSIQAKT